MARLVRSVVILIGLACTPAFAQQADPNLQALLSALMQGTPITLLTPLADGTVQVTSLTAPGQRSAADAAMLIQQAQVTLQNLGVARPTGQQLAAALAGGTVSVPSGSTQLPTLVPKATLNSQVVNAASLPTIVGVSPGSVNAAAGGSMAVTPQVPAAQQAPIVSPAPSAAPAPATPVPPAATPTPFIR